MKNKENAFKQKITIEETNIKKLSSYNKNEKKEKILLISIISLTLIDLILFFTGSNLGILYIPIMCVVFFLLFLYNNCNKIYITIIDDMLIFYDKKEFSHSIKTKDIKEIREKEKQIVVSIKDDNFVSFKTSNKEKVFEKIREEFKK